MSFFRTSARLLAVPAALGVAVLATAGPAAAHVTVTPSSTAAGAYTVLTFSAGHGCDGSPTTEIAISIPEQITTVTPTRNPFWDVKIESETLDEPITDAHGTTVTERDAVVVYTAQEALVDGVRDTFELSVQLPEDAAGETLAFPTVQTCEQGETAWTEIAEDGDSAELDSPAPTLTVTEASTDGHGADAGAGDHADGDSADGDNAGGDSNESGSDDGVDAAVWMGAVGLGAGIVGALAGGAALARTRRQS